MQQFGASESSEGGDSDLGGASFGQGSSEGSSQGNAQSGSQGGASGAQDDDTILDAASFGSSGNGAQRDPDAPTTSSGGPVQGQPNPLLDKSGPVRFDTITAEHIKDGVRELLAEASASLDAIEQSQGPRSYENTLVTIDELGKDVSRAWSLAANLKALARTDELTAAYAEVQPEVSEFFSRFTLSDGVWKALSEYAATPEAAALTGNQKRLLDRTLEEFERLGAKLPPQSKARLAEINTELSKRSTEFSDCVTDARAAFEYVVTDPKQLSGLPQSAVDAAKLNAEQKGIQNAWRFTLDAPSLIPVLTYADDAAMREHFHKASRTLASGGAFDNRDRSIEILRLRREKADLLGQKDFADFQLATRMVGSGQNAKDFLSQVAAHAKSGFERERDELIAYKQSETGDPSAVLDPWDASYYAEKLRQQSYSFDPEELRPYLSADAVLEGTFNVAKELYGLNFRERSDFPTWHADVKVYEVTEADGTPLGNFYVDLFPRENKRGGAWQSTLVDHRHDGNAPGQFLGVIAGNMTKPTADKPALLSHREVETVFHEFGHLLHMMMTSVEERGIRDVPWDFVELPSQIMENWCWDKGVLDTFATHHDSGQVIPDDLFDRALAAKNFRSASMVYRQLAFGTLDLALHTDFDPNSGQDLGDYARDIQRQFSATRVEPDSELTCSFSHIFAGGYAAGYYSYMYADVLQADVFENKFQPAGLFSRAAGDEFRNGLLAKGDTAPALSYYNDYMQRPSSEQPSVAPLMKSLGITAAP